MHKSLAHKIMPLPNVELIAECNSFLGSHLARYCDLGRQKLYYLFSKLCEESSNNGKTGFARYPKKSKKLSTFLEALNLHQTSLI